MSKQKLIVLWAYSAMTLCFAHYGLAQSPNHILSGEYIMTLHLGYGEKSEAEFSVEYISMTFDGVGNGTMETIYSSGDIFFSEPFTYTVNNDGTFSLPINFLGHEAILQGIVSTDGEGFTMFPFSVGFKKSSGMSSTSLSGEYITAAYVTEEDEASAKLISLNFAGDENGTYEIIHSSTGDSGVTGTITYFVNDDGTFFYTDDDSISEFQGIVRSDGKCFTMMQPDSSEFGIYAGIKKSSGMSNASLSGEYIMIQYLMEEESSTEYMLVNFDGGGNGTFEILYSSGGDSGSGSFTYSVNDDGTWFLNITAGVFVASFPGIVSSDGESFTMVTSNSSDVGIYFGIAKSDFTGVIPENNIELPEYFALKQNYPNPFNPNTTIRYILPKSSNVSLKVYNLVGHEITTLVNEKKPTGEYEVQWNAANLSSGVYVCRMQAGEFLQTRKLVLLK